MLLAEPVHAADAETTASTLERLFLEHGAPLVLKSDNGGHFKGAPVGMLLERWGVEQLLSPARTPTYNGSVESAIGRLKSGAAYVAARDGHAGTWTAADLEEARRLANETTRPRGARKSTPTELWRARMPITEDERAAFRARTAAIESELLASGEVGARRAKRDAIRQGLMESGILRIGRRRVRLSKRQLMRARIS